MKNYDSLRVTYGPPQSGQYDALHYVESVLGPTHKEKTKERKTKQVQPPPRPYAELRAASAFSFLEAASLPEDLIATAADRDVPIMAIIDRNGVYGAPRFYGAAKKAGVKALVGSDLVMADDSRLTVLVANRTGYKNLCKLVTAGSAEHPKGQARFTWSLIEQYAEGLHCLTRGRVGQPILPVPASGRTGRIAGPTPLSDEETLHKLAGIFPGRTHIELQRHFIREEEHRNQMLLTLARRMRLPIVATNGVRYARAEEKDLHDVLTCVREGQHVDKAGRLLGVNRERHIKGAAEMCALFADLPQAIDGAWELAHTLDFTLADLGYRFPDYPLPTGETNNSFLRKITWNFAKTRFRPLTARAQAQIEKELNMIEKLELAGYFLIVWDIVQFCAREKILVQGRGSAANSAVCYALGITAVDPVKMDLLFERFLSEERGEWPDIDLDLPSGDQREKVIQHVYKTYGVHGSAMTANVITYRDRSAAREVGKALGYSQEQADKLSKCVSTWNFGEIREKIESLPDELAKTGFDPADVRVQHFMRLYMEIQNLPRHLGQHSGGMVMAKGRLDEIVPLEPASMPGRVVIQWDKDDCADLGLIKVDLLGLGMLAAIEEMIPTIRTHEGQDVDLAHLPQDDKSVYKMLQEADTIGLFQVESRAQMASLPRNKPEKFYDIVVQVAIIRPGPIVGGMIKPFFDRRQGKAKVEYPHPCLEPILKRTLGVPLFQEQLLRIAMVAAGFTGGEAEELRRAMGFKRSIERMLDIEKRLRSGMTERGIGPAAQDQIVKSITSFALYGFPESHAASFALIAYSSAYIKAHHPAAFYMALLNAWPMGFYHPATLVKDAQRHGVEILPIDVNHSGWKCRWEALNERGERWGTDNPTYPDRQDCLSSISGRRVAHDAPRGGVRLGLRFVKGLREAAGRSIESAQTFTSVDDMARRCRLRDDQLTKLADSGALASLGLTRRAAMWQAARAARDSGELFARATPPRAKLPLREMSPVEETMADYQTAEITTGPHLMEHFRARLRHEKILSAEDLRNVPNSSRVTTAGAVIVRQRPGTAKGFVFLTLEDETGLAQAIVNPQLFSDCRSTILGNSGLIVEGIVQNGEGQASVRAEKFWPLEGLGEVQSHDFH
jgi:error-prone DNA polymerase